MLQLSKKISFQKFFSLPVETEISTLWQPQISPIQP